MKEQLLITNLADAQKLYQQIVLTSSLGLEDMVITHVIGTLGLDIQIVTLNTLKLHAETLALVDKIRSKYNLNVHLQTPEAKDLDNYSSLYTEDDIFKSLDARKKCCRVRKVLPLKKVLENKSLWITGQRRSQSSTRNRLEVNEYDDAFGIDKLNPLADWSTEEVWNYIKKHNIPYNTLHDQGFPSIGCAPCTRAVAAGDDERSGRWWWENESNKECGLHVINGKLTRIQKPGAHNVE